MDLASQSSIIQDSDVTQCSFCNELSQGELAAHLCAKCGAPQSLSANEDYFHALRAPKKFKLNLTELEDRFYKISRALHPDRFTRMAPQVQALSLKRMSFINQAYQTLKDPATRRSYLIEKAGIAAHPSPEGQGMNQGINQKIKTKASIPLEIAENWFEIQELLFENPEIAKNKLLEFKKTLQDLQQATAQSIATKEDSYDQSPDAKILEELSDQIQKQNYLASLARDVDKTLNKT